MKKVLDNLWGPLNNGLRDYECQHKQNETEQGDLFKRLPSNLVKVGVSNVLGWGFEFQKRTLINKIQKLQNLEV